MTLFYAPNIMSDPSLPQDESAHAVRVLRMSRGEKIAVTDGQGAWCQCLITNPDPKSCEVEILTVERPKPLWNNNIHIAVAPTKNIERMEWFVEKATEIGIDTITFLRCRYSERRELKTARLEKILVSAMKQSQKAVLPHLTGMTDFQSFVNQQFNGAKFIAHCEADAQKQHLKSYLSKNEDITILIGPEGDFSSEEIALAVNNGFRPVSLGASRLRTETAALVACLSIHLFNN